MTMSRAEGRRLGFRMTPVRFGAPGVVCTEDGYLGP